MLYTTVINDQVSWKRWSLYNDKVQYRTIMLMQKTITKGQWNTNNLFVFYFSFVWWLSTSRFNQTHVLCTRFASYCVLSRFGIIRFNYNSQGYLHWGPLGNQWPSSNPEEYRVGLSNKNYDISKTEQGITWLSMYFLECTLSSSINRGYPAKRALSAMRKHAG